MKTKWSKRPKNESNSIDSTCSTYSSISSSSSSTTTASTTNPYSLKSKATELIVKAESAATATTTTTTTATTKNELPSSNPSSPSNMPPAYSREFPFPRLTLFIQEYENMNKNQHQHHPGVSSAADSTTTSTTGNEISTVPVLTLDDLDAVQVELESLWSKTSVRIRALKNAQQRFLNEPTHSDNDVTTTSSSAVQSTNSHASGSLIMQKSPPGTRKLNAQAISSAITAALQMSRGISSASPSPTKISPGTRRYRKKVRGSVKEVRFRWASDRPTRSGGNRAIKQETSSIPRPSCFWDFADSYCRDLTYADLEALEKTIQEHSAAEESIYDIPPLGKHFRDTENTKTRTRGKTVDRSSRDICGPLTQRLVSALVDNRIHVYHCMKDGNGDGADISSMEGLFISRPGLANALGIDNQSEKSETEESSPQQQLEQQNWTLESRLRKVLVEQGFLSPSEDTDDSSSDPLFIDIDEKDEILADILRTQDSLRSLHKHNAEKLRHLHTLAKRELARSQVKLEMEKADKEVMEAYRLISASRSKKKPLTKRERNLAARALEARRQALEKLTQKPVTTMELTDQ